MRSLGPAPCEPTTAIERPILMTLPSESSARIGLNEPRPAAAAARNSWRAQLSPARVAWALFALLLTVVAVDQVNRSLPFRVDDAYITFSFSKNLGTGHGPVFSHGLRVEGYSNFLWMLVVAVRYVFSAQGDPYGFARVVAFGCVLATCVAVYRLTRRAASSAVSLLAVGLLACCSDLFRAAASGLETTAFCAAIVLGWVVYLEEPPTQRRWSLLAFVPAALLRIDGFVPLLVVFGVEVLSAIAQRRFSFFKLARWAGPAFALWGAYFAWRYAYYGLPLPTTYYAKTLVAANEPGRGANQAWDFLHDYGALPLLPLLGVPLVRGPRYEAACLSIAVVLQLFHAVNVGGDWMPFNRFFLPIVPLLAVLVAWGVAGAFQSVVASSWVVRLGTGLVVFAVLGFAAVHMHMASIDTPQERDKLGNATHVGKHTKENLLAVKDLMSYVVRRPGDRLVTDYAGVFSVFTDAQLIDMWGLCNEDIALHGGINGINPIYGKECAACYARLEPDYFHVNVPMARRENSFRNLGEVLNNVFQGQAIDAVIDIRHRFAVGRVVEESSGRTLWFLERRRPELPLEVRRPASGFRVDYPFEAKRHAD